MNKHVYRVLLVVMVLFVGVSVQAKSSPFPDVDTYNFSRVAITYLQQEGIVKGAGSGRFEPQSLITRAEFAALLLRAAEIPLVSSGASFPDVDHTAWYSTVVDTAVASGVMSGYPDGTFAPQQSVTKAEAAAMLVRLFQIDESQYNSKSWSDMESGVWYEKYMLTLISNNADPFVTDTEAFPSRQLSRSEAAELLFRTLVVHGNNQPFSSTVIKEDEDSISIPRRSVQQGESSYFDTLTKEERSRITLLERTSSAVVSVIGTNSRTDLEDYLKTLAGSSGEPRSSVELAYDVTHGSGFFVTASGVVATNKHVVEEDIAYSVRLLSGEVYPVKKIYKDAALDVALLELDISTSIKQTYLNLLPPSVEPLVGQDIYTIGNPLGRYPGSVGEGIITGMGRTLQTLGSTGGLVRLYDALQTNAEISKGNSGGPLIDVHGMVVGMATALDNEGENLGFAISHEYLAAAIDSFRIYGEFHKPYLGVRYITLSPEVAANYNIGVNYGAYLLSTGGTAAVEPGSPAAQAGLQEEDVIVSVGGRKLGPLVELGDPLSLYRQGEVVEMQVLRNGDIQQIKVRLESRPVGTL